MSLLEFAGTIVNNQATLTGKHPIAQLAEPYTLPQAWELSSDTSAKQFVEQVLQSYGYSLEWLCDDWLMKKSAFSVFGTPIKAIQYVAETINAFLLPLPDQQTLRVNVKHKFKSWFWQGQTPDLVLPENLTLSLSGEFIPKKDVNCVFVQGTKPSAVGAKVVLQGTAGDKPLSEVSHDLVRDTVVARL